MVYTAGCILNTQPEEELIISAPNQPEDSGQTEDNHSNDDNDQHEQGLRPVHPCVANQVQIEKIIDSTNAPGPLTRSRATQLANFYGHFSFVSISQLQTPGYQARVRAQEIFPQLGHVRKGMLQDSRGGRRTWE